jgi:hypothetical protein
MTIGKDEADRIAAALVATDFDAVERDGFRAAWLPEGDKVRVTDLDSDEEVLFDAEDLVRAESDTEVRNARDPGETT